MTLKPFQKAEDVPALPVMNDFYTQRLIELGAIPKNKLEDGKWYYGEKNGFRVSDCDLSPFQLYKRNCKNLTNRIKKKLFENWDGFDFYDVVLS